MIIIAEPQLTPSMEEQAIARAHRMGQANTAPDAVATGAAADLVAAERARLKAA